MRAKASDRNPAGQRPRQPHATLVSTGRRRARVLRLGAALIGLLGALSACHRHRDEAPRSSAPATRASATAPQASSSSRPTATPTAVELPAPQVLLRLDEPAYGCTLAVDPDATYVLMQAAAFRLSRDGALQRMAVDLGIGPALTDTSILFWSQGYLREMPKKGGDVRPIAKLAHQPQQLLTSRGHVMWLDHGEDGVYRLQLLEGKTARTRYASPEAIVGVTMHQDWLFFLEQGAAGWRVGGLQAAQGEPTFTAWHQGRTPAMLAHDAQGLFFYDGPSLTVRRLSPDLLEERVIAEGTICSPMSAARDLFCGQVGGMVRIGLGTPEVMKITEAVGGPITNIAADSQRVVWLVDAGANKLMLQQLTLPTPGQPLPAMPAPSNSEGGRQNP